MTDILGAMTDVFTLTGTVISQITAQPVLLFLLASSMVGVGIGTFASLKNVAR